MFKYTSFGKVAEAGVQAALLAQAGFNGDTDALDGPYCFWKSADQTAWQPDKLIEGLGQDWTHKVGYKTYPSNLPTAGAKDCFIALIQENNMKPEEIEKITARISNVWRFKSQSENRLLTEEDYVFNIKYQLACAAYGLKPTHWLDPDVRKDRKIRAFMERVQYDIGHDEEKFNAARQTDPAAHYMRAEILTGSQTFTKDTIYNKGANKPGFQLTDDDLVEKFTENVSRILSKDKAGKVVDAVWKLDRILSVNDFTGLLAP
jgi:2-methylcitrate dehydratase PrpD